MSYLEENMDELREEADVREQDIAEGWNPPIHHPAFESVEEEEKELVALHEYEANKVDPKN